MHVGDHEFPDNCPPDCPFDEDLLKNGQSSICGRCPVFCCTPVRDPDGFEFCLVEPGDYRPDWAAEWAEFFRSGAFPRLVL
jgi:hypothetical protein